MHNATLPVDPLRTILVERLGCRLPIVQTAMGWIAEPALVAATANAGGFGFLGAAVMKPAEARAKIAAVRAATVAPFGVNFHMFQPGASEIVEAILANKDQIRAVSFGRGPDAGMIGRFRDAGILCMPTVGAVKHARKMAELGVDIITVQGGEGGGHTGAVPTTILLPQVLDSVSIPVVAAGGFADGRGLAAALAYGAVGIAMGTRFLMTQESPVPTVSKARYLQAGTDDIGVTIRLDGLPQRMIKTPFFEKLERSGRISMWFRALEAARTMKSATGASWGDLINTARGMTGHGELSFTQAMLAAAAPSMIMKAVVDGKPDEGMLATGMVAGRVDDLPAVAELIARIAAEARERIAALSHPLAIT